MKNENSLFYKIINKLKVKMNNVLDVSPEDIFPLRPELPVLKGFSEDKLFNFVKNIRVTDAPSEEMQNYCKQDFRRFVYTFGLVQSLSGKCLELGANPYFTTVLIQEFGQLKLTLANYFGSNFSSKVVQEVAYQDFSGDERVVKFESSHFNIESEPFPFPDQEFDVVLFCEIIEHLLLDPVTVLLEIKRVLKPNGYLILTTPNVSRLENVARMISGTNIYDPYSGYGAYGRHNREYNKHELYLLLDYLGFKIDSMFTADVHNNYTNNYISVSKLKPFLKYREHDLGQYIFIKALNTGEAHRKKPAFLYRSYPAGELE
jgi:SAM-dependent methyltransferase